MDTARDRWPAEGMPYDPCQYFTGSQTIRGFADHPPQSPPEKPSGGLSACSDVLPGDPSYGTTWQHDALNCFCCDAQFGVMNRRHHCRICGKCVCHACSPHSIQRKGEAQRMCNICFLAGAGAIDLLPRLQGLREKLHRFTNLNSDSAPSPQNSTLPAQALAQCEAAIGPLCEVFAEATSTAARSKEVAAEQFRLLCVATERVLIEERRLRVEALGQWQTRSSDVEHERRLRRLAEARAAQAKGEFGEEVQKISNHELEGWLQESLESLCQLVDAPQKSGAVSNNHTPRHSFFTAPSTSSVFEGTGHNKSLNDNESDATPNRAESTRKQDHSAITKVGSFPLKALAWEENRASCSICDRPMGKRFLRPRHHCRKCGKCICSQCSPSFVVMPTVSRSCTAGAQRVCTPCIVRSNLLPQLEALTSVDEAARYMARHCPHMCK